MGDTYSRVYHLPARLQKARDKVAKIKRAIWFLGNQGTLPERRALITAESRLQSLENEARQYNFLDLIDDTA